MFSEIVDSVVSRSGRKDRLLDIVDYVNGTIRECQAKGLFYKDGYEDEIPVALVDPLIWTPSYAIRHLRTVKYSDLSYPRLRQPGKVQQCQEQYYYAAGNYYVFVGSSGSSWTDPTLPGYVYVYSYLWQPRLKYYAVGLRPATYDDEAQVWTYYNLIGVAGVSPTLQQDWTQAANQPQALLYVTNWLLTDHREMIKEGTLAKLFKSVGDNARANLAYQLYIELRRDFVATELQESLEK